MPSVDASLQGLLGNVNLLNGANVLGNSEITQNFNSVGNTGHRGGGQHHVRGGGGGQHHVRGGGGGQHHVRGGGHHHVRGGGHHHGGGNAGESQDIQKLIEGLKGDWSQKQVDQLRDLAGEEGLGKEDMKSLLGKIGDFISPREAQAVVDLAGKDGLESENMETFIDKVGGALTSFEAEALSRLAGDDGLTMDQWKQLEANFNNSSEPPSEAEKELLEQMKPAGVDGDNGNDDQQPDGDDEGAGLSDVFNGATFANIFNFGNFFSSAFSGNRW